MVNRGWYKCIRYKWEVYRDVETWAALLKNVYDKSNHVFVWLKVLLLLHNSNLTLFFEYFCSMFMKVWLKDTDSSMVNEQLMLKN